MKPAKNRERILQASITLFNESGVVAVTTNHIAEHLSISPGNLYFHFSNREEIVRELFERMCSDTYKVWQPEKGPAPRTPLDFILSAYEIFWNYRFFHREMYHLRRRDPDLTRKWKAHIKKTVRLLLTSYHRWVKDGLMRPIQDPAEMQLISDVVLITSSSFLHFFESREKPASRRLLKPGLHHIVRILLPYATESYRPAMQGYLGGTTNPVVAPHTILDIDHSSVSQSIN